mmetsp:Transcript_16723/g.40354  ORF Transcript_16723/g.40354 Transcript_16723/m.40354 type:complete len:226 (-) Transcript_16723:368-1045(-)
MGVADVAEEDLVERPVALPVVDLGLDELRGGRDLSSHRVLHLDNALVHGLDLENLVALSPFVVVIVVVLVLIILLLLQIRIPVLVLLIRLVLVLLGIDRSLLHGLLRSSRSLQPAARRPSLSRTTHRWQRVTPAPCLFCEHSLLFTSDRVHAWLGKPGRWRVGHVGGDKGGVGESGERRTALAAAGLWARVMRSVGSESRVCGAAVRDRARCRNRVERREQLLGD